MKVLNLQCENGHTFEGWFGSEDDYASQNSRLLIQCPVCSSGKIIKRLSAPRLNLHTPRMDSETAEKESSMSVVSPGQSVQPGIAPQAVASWLEVAKKIIANTTDVGTRFAEEARKMHYGETEHHGIRGQTTLQEAQELLEEGVEIMPLSLPDSLKETLQ